MVIEGLLKRKEKNNLSKTEMSQGQGNSLHGALRNWIMKGMRDLAIREMLIQGNDIQ